jgi:hypothetical protein
MDRQKRHCVCAGRNGGVCGRVEVSQRRCDVSRSREDSGIERCAGHAPSADARTPHLARSRSASLCARDRMRRRRDCRSGIHRSRGSAE